MEQVKTFYRRYRWLFLAAAYLVVFAVGVLYLRVTISIPPEGDDKLTLNRWMYDFQRMSFWQYLLQDLQGRLRYFTLQEVRFFPFHYPNAVALLFYRTLASYRLYIIAMTGAAVFLVSRVAAKLSRSFRSCKAYCQKDMRPISYSHPFRVSLSSPSAGTLMVTRRYITAAANTARYSTASAARRTAVFCFFISFLPLPGYSRR